MSTVKFSMLQILVTKVENIRMHENPTFSSFYSELSDIVNSSFNLEKPIPNPKIVRKFFRSLLELLERFKPKVTTIENSKDIDSMKVLPLRRVKTLIR